MANNKGIRYTPEQREQLRVEAVRLYTEGATREEVAEALGCSIATIRVFLVSSNVPLRDRRKAELPEGMITAAEAAEIIGMGHAAFNTLRHRGEGPPQAERPRNGHRHYTYYWRSDVEQWISDRAERRVQRVRAREERKAHRARMAEENAIPWFALDWDTLIAACDAKREIDELTWQNVADSAGIDAAHISRIRRGYEPAKGIAAFLRLVIWVTGSVPDEIKRFTRPAMDADDEAA